MSFVTSFAAFRTLGEAQTSRGSPNKHHVHLRLTYTLPTLRLDSTHGEAETRPCLSQMPSGACEVPETWGGVGSKQMVPLISLT